MSGFYSTSTQASVVKNIPRLEYRKKHSYGYILVELERFFFKVGLATKCESVLSVLHFNYFICYSEIL